MPEYDWNQWKMTTFGFLFAGAIALMTTLVLGYRDEQGGIRPLPAGMHGNTSAYRVSLPNQSDVETCNAYAKRQAVGSVAGGAEYEAAYRSCMRQKGY